MKKTITSVVFISVFTAYALYQHIGNTTIATAAQTASAVSSQVETTQTQTVADIAPATKPKGAYADGTYTGASENAYYGNVQVRVAISGGKITDVAFLDYPSDRGTSREINAVAMPQLKQEALAAQSANVDGVSGASDTSAAFRQSLASALSQAKA